MQVTTYKHMRLLRFKGEASSNLGGGAGKQKNELWNHSAANLMSRASGGDIVQLLGIDRETERTLDTRTQRLGVS